MNNDLIAVKQKIQKMDFQLNHTKVQLENTIDEKNQCAKQLNAYKEAKDLIEQAAAVVQRSIPNYFAEIATNALKVVMDDPYQIILEYVKRRNTIECDIVLMKDNQEYSMMDGCGYGVVDVISVALRIAFVALGGTRKLIIFDEPCRFVSTGMMDLVAALFKSLSQELNIQIVIVTHSTILAECGTCISIEDLPESVAQRITPKKCKKHLT